jgi:hypothetical protein
MGKYYYWRSGTGYEINLSAWPYQVVSEDGLGGPETEMYSHVVPLQDGSLYLGNRRLMRRFTIGLEIMGHSDVEVEEARQDLLAALNGQWGLGAFGRDRGGVRREVYCLPVNPPRFQAGLGDDLGFRDVVEFAAPDFAFYDPAERSVAASLDTQTDLVLAMTFSIRFGSSVIAASPIATVYGDQPVYPIITLTGPLTVPVVRNLTTGEVLDFAGGGGLVLAAGESAEVDCRPGFKTVTKNDGTNLVPYLTTDSDLVTFHLAPPPPERRATLGSIPPQMGVTQQVWATDGQNELQLYGATATPDSSLTVKWHDRWGGI